MAVSFVNKVVLVTGASAGIGEATALSFAKLGAKLALVGRNEERLANVAGRCEREKGLKPLAIVADLATEAGCETTSKKTLDHFQKLDVLINNAGVVARTSIQLTNMGQYDSVFDTNVRGVYNLTRLLVPALLETRGNIVNISSVGGSSVSVGSLPYAMTKAALDHFTRLVALELAPQGVRVNAVSPGFTVSNLVQRVTNLTDEEYNAWLGKMAKLVPMGEVCQASDVANMVVHIASDASRLVTGVVVPVDGGLRYGNLSHYAADQME